MRLIHRLTDILSANVNELIERYEDPELLLKQAVREMDDSLNSALGNAVKVVAHEKLLARELADEETAIAALRRRAEAAVGQGDDATARETLKQKREREATHARLTQQLVEATAVGQSLRRQIHAMRLRLEDARRKLTLLAARQRAAEARQRLLREFSAAPIGDEAFQKFERMCRKVDRTEAEAEALADLAGWVQPCDDLLAIDAADDESIEAELGELKAKCGK
jgi:phage shock protein A